MTFQSFSHPKFLKSPIGTHTMQVNIKQKQKSGLCTLYITYIYVEYFIFSEACLCNMIFLSLIFSAASLLQIFSMQTSIHF